MNPKEKAKEVANYIEGILGNSVPTGDDIYFEETKMLSKFHVDGILKLSGLPQYQVIFWNEVKTEIEKL